MVGLVEMIFKAGVVGCGGAGFPTHVKLAGQSKWFIVNGAECEPLLRTDRSIMLRHSEELVAVIDTVAKHLQAEKAVIALKRSYKKEIDALAQAIGKLGVRVELFLLDHFYPAGDEQVIVQQVTGMTVPPAGIPRDVGVVVSNVATMLGVHDALAGRPFTFKYVTVTGAVKKPVVLRVPLGTFIDDCLALAGGPTIENWRIIDGGPLMGKVLDKGSEIQRSVSKTVSGLVVVPDDSYLAELPEISVQHTVNRARAACIQCSYCTIMCPRYLIGHPLQPHRIMRKLAHGGSLDAILDDEDVKQALICCECGICEIYACPMDLQPRRVNVLLKRKYAEVGIKYTRQPGEYVVRNEFEDRKVPTKRIAARAEVGAYYDIDIDIVIEHMPDRVSIALKQHIGAAAQPLVNVGDLVEAGQMIAACPSDTLGANIHTGIGGRVTRIDSSIVIERA